MKRFLRSRLWIIPIALLALVGISYGVLASKLGFYWDDWTIAWYIHFLGPSSFIKAFSFDRPLLSLVYLLTTPIFGESPAAWQFFAIGARWLACYALWWVLHGLWPRRIVQTTMIALLFAVYPGFLQQHIAITYGNAFLVLSGYLASFAMMVWAVRRPRSRTFLYAASIPLAAYSVFTAEHFFGLELLRPIFIWIVLSDAIIELKSRLKHTVILWIPYLIIDLLFLIWRISTPTPRAEITLLKSLNENPIQAFTALVNTIVADLYTSAIAALQPIVDLNWLTAYPPAVLYKWIMIVIAASAVAGAALLLIRPKLIDNGIKVPDRRWALGAIGLGIFALLAAGIPIWPTNLRIALDFPWDRFTLPMMFGAALLWVGLIELTTFLPYQNIVLVALLAGLASGFHYQNGLKFRMDWLAQRDYFWQLTWRAPGIKPGTILLTSEMPFTYDWDNSLTAPLNWTYAPDLKKLELPYLMYNAESRLSSGLPDLEKSTEINETLRITPFSGSISQTLLAFFRPPGSCFKLIDPKIDMFLPDKPRYFKEIVEFSDPSLIQAEAVPQAKPPLQFFGPEPEPDWCYYFEKAELARQVRDWNLIVQLAEPAFQEEKTFFRKNAFELLPFIEGYVRMGMWDQAADLSSKAYIAWENMNASVCKIWENAQLEKVLDQRGMNVFETLKETIHCPNR